MSTYELHRHFFSLVNNGTFYKKLSGYNTITTSYVRRLIREEIGDVLLSEQVSALAYALLYYYKDDLTVSDTYSIGVNNALKDSYNEVGSYQIINNESSVNPCSEVYLDKPNPCYLAPKEKEITMNKSFETRHYIDGTDTNSMSEQQMFDALAAIEGKIDKLKKIKTESKAIKRQIKQYKKDIASIVKILDGVKINEQ